MDQAYKTSGSNDGDNDDQENDGDENGDGENGGVDPLSTPHNATAGSDGVLREHSPNRGRSSKVV